MATVSLTKRVHAVVNVRVVMAAGPLVRGADVVVGASVAVAVEYFYLRSGVKCSGDAGEERWLVGVTGSPG